MEKMCGLEILKSKIFKSNLPDFKNLADLKIFKINKIMISFNQEYNTALLLLCKKFTVNNLYLFGSATGDNFRSDSDIDLLVTFSDEVPLLDYGDNYFDFKYELEDLFKRKVDLVTEKSLTNPYLIQSINRNKQLLYERKYKEIFV